MKKRQRINAQRIRVLVRRRGTLSPNEQQTGTDCLRYGRDQTRTRREGRLSGSNKLGRVASGIWTP